MTEGAGMGGRGRVREDRWANKGGREGERGGWVPGVKHLSHGMSGDSCKRVAKVPLLCVRSAGQVLGFRVHLPAWLPACLHNCLPSFHFEHKESVRHFPPSHHVAEWHDRMATDPPMVLRCPCSSLKGSHDSLFFTWPLTVQ